MQKDKTCDKTVYNSPFILSFCDYRFIKAVKEIAACVYTSGVQQEPSKKKMKGRKKIKQDVD